VIEFCPVESLDRIEQYYINKYLEQEDCEIYNVTGGGQFDKKADIGERQQTKLKSFKNGKDLGYKKAIAEVKVYFKKYLDFKIKGKENKIKQRKYEEFKELLSD
jgi:hypothetical protein